MADDRKNNDGRGNFGNPEQHAEAGRKGGEKTAETHDKGFYEEIGSEGGKVSGGNFKNDPERAREAGRKGGQARSDSSDNSDDR